MHRMLTLLVSWRVLIDSIDSIYWSDFNRISCQPTPCPVRPVWLTPRRMCNKQARPLPVQLRYLRLFPVCTRSLTSFLFEKLFSLNLLQLFSPKQVCRFPQWCQSRVQCYVLGQFVCRQNFAHHSVIFGNRRIFMWKLIGMILLSDSPVTVSFASWAAHWALIDRLVVIGFKAVNCCFNCGTRPVKNDIPVWFDPISASRTPFCSCTTSKIANPSTKFVNGCPPLRQVVNLLFWIRLNDWFLFDQLIDSGQCLWSKSSSSHSGGKQNRPSTWSAKGCGDHGTRNAIRQRKFAMKID